MYSVAIEVTKPDKTKEKKTIYRLSESMEQFMDLLRITIDRRWPGKDFTVAVAMRDINVA